MAHGTRFADLTVDSVVLADLLDRGIKGIRLLSDRQQDSVRTYIDKTNASLAAQATNCRGHARARR